MRSACFACQASVSPSSQTTSSSPKSASGSMKLLQSARAKELAGFLKTVPAVQHAFAYGSGIFKQEGLYSSNKERPMLDFILAVDDPESWHNENISANRKHYSSLAAFGGRSLVCNSERLGAGVHFNPSVSWGQEVVKYGVVRMKLLYEDLVNWDRLYVAGRMQKPVLTLQSNQTIEDANYRNRVSSLVASLLMLPEKFKSQDLYRTIVGLSYLGDIRMGLAEDSKKVERIAAGSSEGLNQIYRPLFQEDELLASCSCAIKETGNSELWHQDHSRTAKQRLLNRLPRAVQVRLTRQMGSNTNSFEEIAEQLSRSVDIRNRITDALAAIVGPSSRGQAVAGLFMAGPARSAKYVMQKVKKKIQ